MSLNGLFVWDQGGIPIYTKTIDVDLKLDPLLISSFLSAIQSFAMEIENTPESYIKELSMQNFKIIFRQFELLTFIGLIDQKTNIKAAQLILEYMIWAFLSKFRYKLLDCDTSETSQFQIFDNYFLKYRGAKEKELIKWLEQNTSSTNKLQDILNRLINFFPINDLIKLNTEKLVIIGKKLIWVVFNITQEEEQQITDKLREKTTKVYGHQLFESIINSI